MGVVIDLAARRAAREARQEALEIAERPRFWIDLASPFTYLAAERVDRLFGDLDWRPVAAAPPLLPPETLRPVVEARSAALGLPFVWPDQPPVAPPAVLRVGAYAAEQGAGGAFTLALCRLVWCGGFGLDEPETLAEAAAAAGIAQSEVEAVAANPAHDALLTRESERIADADVRLLPALVLGDRILSGERRIAEAAAALAPPAAPLAH